MCAGSHDRGQFTVVLHRRFLCLQNLFQGFLSVNFPQFSSTCLRFPFHPFFPCACLYCLFICYTWSCLFPFLIFVDTFLYSISFTVFIFVYVPLIFSCFRSLHFFLGFSLFLFIHFLLLSVRLFKLCTSQCYVRLKLMAVTRSNFVTKKLNF